MTNHIRLELTPEDPGIVKRARSIEEAEAFLAGKEILETRLPQFIEQPILVRVAEGWLMLEGACE